MMKKMLLAGIAALLLATGPAHADKNKWESDFHRCWVSKQFTHDARDARPGRAFGNKDEVWAEESQTTATISLITRRRGRIAETSFAAQKVYKILPVPRRS